MEGVFVAVISATLGACGALVVAWRSAAWEDRRTRRELTIEVYRDALSLRDDLTQVIGRRHFALQRWLWSIESPSSYVPEEVRASYFDVVRIWNERYWAYHSRLRVLFGEELAMKFLDYADDHRDLPTSLHYLFVTCNAAVLAAESGAAEIGDAQTMIHHLGHNASRFSDELTSLLLSKASSLALLDTGSQSDE